MVTSSDYRNESRTYLAKAQEELASLDDHRLPFAALLLRMAMEALIYARASAYKDEFPPTEYATWQPRKVLAVLLEIDASADQPVSIAVGLEEEYGKPAKEMHFLGTDTPLSMKLLRDHYDALGSYLHVPTIAQRQKEQQPSPTRLRLRCDAVVGALQDTLSSSVWHAIFANYAAFECIECGSKIRRRVADSETKEGVNCFNCLASYAIRAQDDNKVLWRPEQQEITCAEPSCDQKAVFWRREMEIGKGWNCPKCGGKNVFVLGMSHRPVGTTGSQTGEQESESIDPES